MTAATGAAAERDRRGTARASAFVAIAACCFGSISVLTVLATREGLELRSILTWRYLLAVPVLILAAGGLRAMRADGGRIARIIALGGGGQAVVAFLSLSSLAYIPAATLGFLFYTFPAWVALMAAATGREPLTAIRIGALVLSLGGVAFMVGAPGAESMHPTGVVLALSAAVAYAIYIPLVGWVQGPLTPAAASTWVSVGAGAIFAFAAAFEGTLAAPHSPLGVISVVLLALVCTAAAFIAFLRGLAVLGAVRTAIVSTVEPFWTTVLGAVVLLQPAGPGMLIGGACIATSVWLLQRPSRGT